MRSGTSSAVATKVFDSPLSWCCRATCRSQSFSCWWPQSNPSRSWFPVKGSTCIVSLGLLVELHGGLQLGVGLGRVFHQLEQPSPVAGRQADDLLPLDDHLGFLQRRLHQKLIDRRPSQFSRAAQRFIDLVGDASADAILLGSGGSHRLLLN